MMNQMDHFPTEVNSDNVTSTQKYISRSRFVFYRNTNEHPYNAYQLLFKP